MALPYTTGLVIHLDADALTGLSDGDPVSQFDDQSGNAYHASQATASKQPTYRAAAMGRNGMPCLEFDGEDDMMQTPNFASPLAQPNTIFIVFEVLHELGGTRVLIDGLSSSNRHYVDTPDGSNLRQWAGSDNKTRYMPSPFGYIGSFVYNGASSELWDAGRLAVQTSAGSHDWDGMTIGSRYSDSVHGNYRVAEIIGYDHALSTADRESVEAYLEDKYRADVHGGRYGDSAATYDADVATDAPVSYWKLNETSGTTATDAEGTNDGVYENNVTQGQTGPFDEMGEVAALFGGASSDQVRVPDDASLESWSGLTIEFWMRTDDPDQSNAIWVAKHSNGPYYLAQNQGDADGVLRFMTDGVSLSQSNLDTPWRPDRWSAFYGSRWHHVVATWDGETKRVYINGREIASGAYEDTALRTGPDVYLGTYSGTSWGYNGLLDRVALYDKALSAARIRDHYLNATTSDLPYILTGSLPTPTLGDAYSETLEVDGGTAPYTWALASGSLPAGLSLNSSTGEISGTPTDAGTFAFTVTATDDDGDVDAASFSMEVVSHRVTQASLRVLLTLPPGENRVTQTSLRVLLLDPLPPDTPTLEASVDGTTVLASTDEFSSERDDVEHMSTKWQAQAAGGDWSTLLADEDSEDFLTSIVLEELPESTDIEVRAAHVDSDGVSSLWSNVVELTTGLDTPRPETPTVTVEETGFDLGRVSISDFDHTEGVTTAEDWDPDDNDLPYPIAAQIRVRRVSDSAIVADTGLTSTLADTQEALFDDLDADESYETEGRWQDGKYGATSEWSAAVPFSTPAIPPDRPTKPTISVDVCAREGTTISSGPYGHDTPGASGAGHAESQYRVCAVFDDGEGGENTTCSSRIVEDPAELLEITFEELAPGDYRFQVRHGDELGRWGEYSDLSDKCTILPVPPQPRVTAPVSGVAIDADQLIEWEMQEEDWEFRVRLSTDEGETWTVVASELTVEEYLFEIEGRPNGYYLLEIAACYPAAEGGECGDPAYVALYLDRTGQVAVSYDLREFSELPATWEEIHDTSGDVEHILVDDLLSPVGAGNCSDPCVECHEVEGEEELHRKPAGVLSKSTRGLAIRSGFLAFKELGKPTIGDMTISFSIVANDMVWYGWRYALLHYLRGGIGWKGDTGGQGLVNRARAGGQAWPFPQPTGGCDDDDVLMGCLCGFVNCRICTDGALDALPWISRAKPNTIHQYRVPWGQGSIESRGYGILHNTGATIPRSTEKNRGLTVAAQQRFTGGSCCWDFTTYTMRQKVTRDGAGGYRVRVQILGPGIDPEAGWILDKSFGAGTAFAEDCGYCGLALWQIRNLTGDIGILTKSVSVVLPEGFETDGPILGTATLQEEE